jgi:hypothetical protein
MSKLNHRNEIYRHLMVQDYPGISAEPSPEQNGEHSCRTLPEICQSVHMMSSGAADCPPDDYARETCYLRAALAAWNENESIPLTKDYDEAVRNLARVTLSEAERANDVNVGIMEVFA